MVFWFVSLFCQRSVETPASGGGAMDAPGRAGGRGGRAAAAPQSRLGRGRRRRGRPSALDRILTEEDDGLDHEQPVPIAVAPAAPGLLAVPAVAAAPPQLCPHVPTDALAQAMQAQTIGPSLELGRIVASSARVEPTLRCDEHAAKVTKVAEALLGPQSTRTSLDSWVHTAGDLNVTRKTVQQHGGRISAAIALSEGFHQHNIQDQTNSG